MFVELFVGITGTIVATYLWETKIREHVTIHRIKYGADPTMTSLLELYSALFPDDGTNYTCEDMLELVLDENGRRRENYVPVDDVILAAKVQSEVVGFIFCHYYPERQTGIVSYFGINKSSQVARKQAAPRLLKRLLRILHRAEKPCQWLLFEIHVPEPDEDKHTNSERRAKGVLFKQTAKHLGIRAVELDFDYNRPRWSLDPRVEEEPMRLLCATLAKQPLQGTLSKSQVIHLLGTIHLCGYGDYYPVEDRHFQEFHEYLGSRRASYEERLPDPVPIR